jgi:hypothetical protein
MVANHIHDALAQVRQIQDICINGQRFNGYSPRARLLSGLFCLLCTVVLAQVVPATFTWHLGGWLVLMGLSMALNYCALTHWFWTAPEVGREWNRLKPAVEAIGPLLLGGLFSWMVIRLGKPALSFGICMCMFGLANITSRHLMHKFTGLLGIYYVVCGGIFLLIPDHNFLNPWPMGLVFGFGELIGGSIMHLDDRRKMLNGENP